MSFAAANGTRAWTLPTLAKYTHVNPITLVKWKIIKG